jgi:hypothetical protein
LAVLINSSSTAPAVIASPQGVAIQGRRGAAAPDRFVATLLAVTVSERRFAAYKNPDCFFVIASRVSGVAIQGERRAVALPASSRRSSQTGPRYVRPMRHTPS